MAHFGARRALTSLLTRTLSVSSSLASSSLSPSRSLLALTVVEHHLRNLFRPTSAILTRSKTSGSGYSPLNDPSPNWSNRPPKETILLDGCDYEHWLIVMEFSEDPKPSPEEMVNTYVKTLAQVVGRWHICVYVSLVFVLGPVFPVIWLLAFGLCFRWQWGGGKEEDLLGFHHYLYWVWCFDFWGTVVQS